MRNGDNQPNESWSFSQRKKGRKRRRCLPTCLAADDLVAVCISSLQPFVLCRLPSCSLAAAPSVIILFRLSSSASPRSQSQSSSQSRSLAFLFPDLLAFVCARGQAGGEAQSSSAFLPCLLAAFLPCLRSSPLPSPRLFPFFPSLACLPACLPARLGRERKEKEDNEPGLRSGRQHN